MTSKFVFALPSESKYMTSPKERDVPDTIFHSPSEL